jgi:hypothetical protein
MLIFDERSDFPFLCISDEMRATFRAYSAVCTPGFFVGLSPLLPQAQLKGGLGAARSPGFAGSSEQFLALGRLM